MATPASGNSQKVRSSRQRYQSFVQDYKRRRLDHAGEPAGAVRRGKRRTYLRDYVRWLRPQRWPILALMVLALLAAGLQLIEPLFMRFIVDRVLLNQALNATSRLTSLHSAGALFLILIILTNLVNAFRDYRQRLVNRRITLALRKSLYRKLLHLPLPKLWDMKTGGILSRITGDVDATIGLLQMAIVTPFVSVVRLAIAIVVLMALNWRLALTALAVIPAVVAISFVSVRRIKPIHRSVRKDLASLDGRVGETFSGIRVVRTFRREMQELFEYMRARHAMLRKELFAHRREIIIWTSWSLLLGTLNVVIVWYGGYLNLQGRASLGDLMAFQWYTFLLLNPVLSIMNSFSELQRSLASVERVAEVLDMEEDKPDRPDAREAPRVVDAIEFENVTFEYHKGRPVVRDFNFVVPGGSVVALIGRSGAGKTTVTDLIARFHDPTRGCILVNGSDIRDIRLRTYRDLLAIVEQHVFLFDGSVRDNIAYGRHDATDVEVENAARLANAHEFIVRLPEQYETFIGERGVKLSGGQQQRLAIARAILADPQILILDEATSNLDTESERLIQASMSTLLAGRTTFVIAHRLSTIRRADLILLMEDGRIIESGDHEQLMESRGAYYDMVLRQIEVEAKGPIPA